MKLSVVIPAFAFSSAYAKHMFGNRQLRHGVATKELLKNSIPYKARQLDGAYVDNDVDGSYRISLGKCVDIKTKSDDLFNENFIDQVQSGNALSLKSYVLFYACQDYYGYGCSEDDSDVYMIDLPTYLSVVGKKQAYQRNDYCEQCEKNQEYCAANVNAYEAANDDYKNDDAEDQVEEEQEEQEGNNEDEMEEEQEDNNEDEREEEQEEQQENNEDQMQEEDQKEDQEDGGVRRLKQQIDCSKCSDLQCFDKYADDDAVVNQAGNKEEIDNYIAEWIENIANCMETDNFVNGQPVYIGPICSDYADTFEIGAFLDEDCTIYTNLASFQDIVEAEKNNYSVDVPGYAINALKAAFYEPMTCESQEFAEGEQEDEDEEENEMNEYCEQLLEGESVNFQECAAEEEQQDEGDDTYNWYSFDVENADEIEEVCAKVISFNGVYSNYYDSISSGSLHTRDRKGNLVSGEAASLSVGAIVAIVLACVVVVGVASRLLTRSCRRKVKAPALHEPVYHGNRIS